MQNLSELREVINSGGAVTHAGEVITNLGRLEEVHKAYKPEATTPVSKGDKKATERAEKAEADLATLQAEHDKAKEAFTKLTERNQAQADLIDALGCTEDDLSALSPKALRAIAAFEGVKVGKDDKEADVVTAILEKRTAPDAGQGS